MAEKRYAPETSEGGPSKEEETAKPWAPFCLSLAPLAAKVRGMVNRGQNDSRVEPFETAKQRPSRTETGEGGKSDSQYQMYLHLLTGHQQHEIREAFNKFDRDGSGFMCAATRDCRRRVGHRI